MNRKKKCPIYQKQLQKFIQEYSGGKDKKNQKITMSTMKKIQTERQELGRLKENNKELNKMRII